MATLASSQEHLVRAHLGGKHYHLNGMLQRQLRVTLLFWIWQGTASFTGEIGTSKQVFIHRQFKEADAAFKDFWDCLETCSTTEKWYELIDQQIMLHREWVIPGPSPHVEKKI
ncbi:hypothetical protein KXW98_002534 [Aspergillus fumigatus]|nr:hypothetical protein KXX45_001392 [Aspergillus fumigatus]KAH1386885.1 hypothetical protein KXX10_003604 [Aspergillus fumigatus]KAH1473984.1 hypothetical protein KXX53_006692 [Aspergillus fumigatus]KAH1483091.1 hypothetical protein KXX26_006155 [Aspergillus fumigatus]KAH1540204.1 hypothetical protein KXX61_006390 [Aspergillus fumigatus]